MDQGSILFDCLLASENVHVHECCVNALSKLTIVVYIMMYELTMHADSEAGHMTSNILTLVLVALSNNPGRGVWVWD